MNAIIKSIKLKKMLNRYYFKITMESQKYVKNKGYRIYYNLIF